MLLLYPEPVDRPCPWMKWVWRLSPPRWAGLKKICGLTRQFSASAVTHRLPGRLMERWKQALADAETHSAAVAMSFILDRISKRHGVLRSSLAPVAACHSSAGRTVMDSSSC